MTVSGASADLLVGEESARPEQLTLWADRVITRYLARRRRENFDAVFRCRKGHLLTPELVFRQKDSSSPRCRVCRRAAMVRFRQNHKEPAKPTLPHVPASPLRDHILRLERVFLLTHEEIAVRYGTTRRQIERLLSFETVSVNQADKWATIFGLDHPELLWPEWGEVA